MKNLIISVFFVAVSAAAVSAQIAQGGTYKLEQAVVAGGGTSADATGSVYKLDGVIGEPVAGTTSSGAAYSIKSGFLTTNGFAPTAATVSISGRILTADGSGLMNARVTLTDASGNARTILSKKSGAFRFDDVAVGEVYIISVNSRRYTFQPQAFSVTENLADVNLTAEQTTIFF